jgi:hypothetical protein
VKSVRRNPLIIATLATVLLLGFTLTKSGKTQTTKTQKRDSSQKLIEATRNGGLREAARIKKNFVSSERASGWAKYDLERLTQNSSLIVIGTPILSTSRLSDSGQQILTEHQVRVEQTLKGTVTPNHVLTVTVIGGKLIFEDGTTAEIRTPDLGPINAGKTYIFFLRERQNASTDNFGLTGGGQGLFEIASDSTIEPQGEKVDTVQNHKHATATSFVEEIKIAISKYPGTSRCCK